MLIEKVDGCHHGHLLVIVIAWYDIILILDAHSLDAYSMVYLGWDVR